MNKVISLQQAIKLSKKLKSEGKTIVLVGGCFDIFHYGHFVFLKKARALGDILIIALENDKRVRELKGKNRPVTNEKARAEILSAFPFVDYVAILPDLIGNKAYRDLTMRLKPSIIATTVGDKQLENKKEQAKAVNGKVIQIPLVKTPSTSQILRIFMREQ